MSSEESKITQTSEEADLVQYIVLLKSKGFSTGALVAQGAHASVSAIWLSRESSFTKQYCGPGALDRMHKVTLEAPSRDVLEELSNVLSNAKPDPITHKLWIELPEAIPTALATAPLPRTLLKPFFSALKLLR
jgi:peptidyl-tRNA hydrolase